MKKYFLILGRGKAAEMIGGIILKIHSNFIPIKVAYGKDNGDIENSLMIEKERELDQIKKFININQIVGVINRFDSYIPLYGKIVDEYGLFGSSFESVMLFKDKSKMHEMMQVNGLQEYRPKTKIVGFEDLEEYLKEANFLVVVKPFVGAKSRGVLVLKDEDEVTNALKRLDKHFNSEKVGRTVDKDEKRVLVEEYVIGKQFTFTGFVDAEGELRQLGWERVYRGVDVGQKHQQLVYRTTEVDIDKEILNQAFGLLKQLVEVSGLKSTFIFPDFIVTEEGRLLLIELNVRIGGFRAEMYRYAYGIDLDEIAIKLALGEKVLENKKCEKSCTAVEVWTDKSGVIKNLSFPIVDETWDFKQYFQVGDEYIAPPIGDKPLAKFLVVDDKDSLDRARMIREKFYIEIK